MIIETRKKPTTNDVLVYDGKEWTVVDYNKITKELREEVENLTKTIIDLKNYVVELNKEIDTKLEHYHNILQILTKEK